MSKALVGLLRMEQVALYRYGVVNDWKTCDNKNTTGHSRSTTSNQVN